MKKWSPSLKEDKDLNEINYKLVFGWNGAYGCGIMVPKDIML